MTQSKRRLTGTCEQTQAIGVYTPSHHRCSVEEEETDSACVLGLVWHSTPAPQRKGLPVPTQRQAWSDGSTGLACCGPCSSSPPLKHCTPSHTQPDCSRILHLCQWALVSWHKHPPHSTLWSQTHSPLQSHTQISTHSGPRPTLINPPSSKLTAFCLSSLSPESKLWLCSIVWERSLRWCSTAIFFILDSLSYRLLLVSFTCAECEGS